MSWERCQQGLCLFKPTTYDLSYYSDWPFWKKQLVLQNVSCKYWEVIQQLVPLNSLHAGIGIRAEQAECLHFFLMHSFEGYGQKVTRCFYNVFSDVIFDPLVLQCFRVSENSPSASMSYSSDDLAQLLPCLYFWTCGPILICQSENTCL